MVAVPLPERRRVSGSRRSQVAQRKVQRQKRSLELLQGALSTHRMARQAPWLANLHRMADGALLATGVAALAMAGLTLHWQGRWGGDFRQLQRAQALEHRLMESQSALEQHYLRQAKRPGALVATSSQDLVFLPSPPAAAKSSSKTSPSLKLNWIAAGY